MLHLTIIIPLLSLFRNFLQTEAEKKEKLSKKSSKFNQLLELDHLLGFL